MTFASPIVMALSLMTSVAPSTNPSLDLPPATPRRSIQVAMVEPQCELRRLGSASVDSTRCTACHGTRSGVASGCSHPVGMRYRRARGYDNGRLRSEGEVERRGVQLNDGRVECTSCHDGSSKWADHIVQLPGTTVEAASLPPAPGRTLQRRAGAVRAGGAIDTTPLCSACHNVTEF